jgi:glutathione S-transferase
VQDDGHIAGIEGLTMIQLYHCTSARSFRPLWMLEEMGLPYELKMLPFPPRAFDKSYFDVNPLGTVPFMIDGAARMSESTAICHWLGVKHGPTPLVVAPDEPAYAAYLNWLFMSDATLTFPQTLILRYRMFEPKERRQPQVADDYEKWFLGRLRAVEIAAGAGEYLCAGRFTAADIAVGYAVMLAEIIGLGPQLPPSVAQWWARVKSRPGYAQAMAAQKAVARAQNIPAGPV